MEIPLFYDWLKALSKKDQLSIELYGWSRWDNAVSLTTKDKKGSSSQGRLINLRVSQGEKTGLSYTKSFSKQSIEDCYQRAKDSLYWTEKESAGFLSEKQNYSKKQDFYNPEASKISRDQKMDFVEKFHKACSFFDKKIQPLQITLKDEESSYFFVNSLGSQADFKISNLLAGGQCMGRDGESRSQTYMFRYFKSLSQIDPEKIGFELADLTLKKLRSKVPESKRYSVIFQPERAGCFLISYFCDLMNAKKIFDKLSVLNKNSLGKKSFSGGLSIYDDPLKNSGFSSQIFDGEGFAAEKTTLIEKGVIKNFLSSSFNSKKLKIPHTKKASWGAEGEGMDVSASNLIMKTGDSSFEEMLRDQTEVIVIDSLKSFAGYNSVSGDFSLESEGFLYRGGELVHPLSQFTVSGNIIELFQSLSKIENQSYAGPSVEAPSFLAPELSISGK